MFTVRDVITSFPYQAVVQATRQPFGPILKEVSVAGDAASGVAWDPKHGRCQVGLHWQGGSITASCTCPEDGACVHAAALAFALLDRARPSIQEAPAPPIPAPRPERPWRERLDEAMQEEEPAAERIYLARLDVGERLYVSIHLARRGVRRPLVREHPLRAADFPTGERGEEGTVRALLRLLGFPTHPHSVAEHLPVEASALGSVFQLLRRLEHVYWDDDVPVRYGEALHGSLTLREEGDVYRLEAGLRLGESPFAPQSPHPHLLGGDELFLVDAGTIHPVLPDAPQRLLAAVARRPIAIPRHEEDALLTEVLPRLKGRLELPPSLALRLGPPRHPIPTLVLREEDHDLLVEARMDYGQGDGEEEALPGALPTEATLVAVKSADGRPLYLPRLMEEESRYLATLPLPGAEEGRRSWRLRLQEALAFLADELPRLSRDWRVFGEERLARLRLAPHPGSLVVTVASRKDWLDLSLAVRYGDDTADPEALFTALRLRQRFVRLSSGSFARLPERLLALAEGGVRLPEPGRDGSVALPRYAASTVAECLAVADEVAADPGWYALWRGLADRQGIPHVPQPRALQAVLRPYQQAGLDWLMFMAENGLHGILADDMGLGKTLQALALVGALRERGEAGPYLVVCPTSLLFNWAAEAGRFAPDLKVTLWNGQNRRSMRSVLATADLVLTTYALLRRDEDLFARIPFTAVFLDEAQNIKNPLSKVAHAACRLEAKHRFCLTGTPIENNLVELWSLMHFLLPGYLGSLQHFRNEFAQPIAAGDERRLERLRRMIQPFILRRRKEDVLTELPERQEILVTVDLTPAQRHLYDSTREAYRRSLLPAVEREGMQALRMHVLEALLRLRQICCDPRLVDPRLSARHSAKLERLLELLDDILANGQNVLVFSQFVSLLELVGRELASRHIRYAYLDGSTRDRAAAVAEFQGGEADVFLISLRAGGTGLNLTRASCVVHLDPWWNPAVQEQATSRAHRMGQRRSVLDYKLLTRGTVEEKIRALQEEKEALAARLLESDGEGGDVLTPEDLEYLLS